MWKELTEFVISGQELPKNHSSFLTNNDRKEITKKGRTSVSGEDRIIFLFWMLSNNGMEFVNYTIVFFIKLN